MKKAFFLILLGVMFMSCSGQKQFNTKPELILYRFPDKVENLLQEQIRLNPKEDYSLLIDQDNNNITIKLVESFSYYHKKTSYQALIGDKFYPISFPEFDRKFGVSENAIEVIKRKVKTKNRNEFFTKQSYPIYHNFYEIKLNGEGDIIAKGFVH